MFSKACEYGIRATIYVAGQSHNNNRVSLKEIAREIDSPEAFTAKILQQLVRSGAIDSIKGPTGGFAIDKTKMKDIRLGHIVRTIDGDRVFSGCGLGMKECSAVRPCPVHHKFKIVRDELNHMLEKTSVYDMMIGYHDGLTFLRK